MLINIFISGSGVPWNLAMPDSDGISSDLTKVQNVYDLGVIAHNNFKSSARCMLPKLTEHLLVEYRRLSRRRIQNLSVHIWSIVLKHGQRLFVLVSGE